MKIGIVGAENSHAAAIARLINVERKFPGASVDYLWGETREFAEKTAEAGQIATIVKRPESMLGLTGRLLANLYLHSQNIYKKGF